MDVSEVLSVLKQLADAGALSLDAAGTPAGGDVRLLMETASAADARSRAAIGTDDFERWGTVALACAQAIPASARRP